MGYCRNNRKVESGNAAAGVRAFPFYDGNGNICGYTDATGAVQTRYLYDGFLNVTQTGTGSYRYQASTKSWNPALGLLEYQFRAYSPELGRWIQEDPIEEAGGNNLYGWINNSGIAGFDRLGLFASLSEIPMPKILLDMYLAINKTSINGGTMYPEVAFEYADIYVMDKGRDAKLAEWIQFNGNLMLSILSLGAEDASAKIVSNVSKGYNFIFDYYQRGGEQATIALVEKISSGLLADKLGTAAIDYLRDTNALDEKALKELAMSPVKLEKKLRQILEKRVRDASTVIYNEKYDFGQGMMGDIRIELNMPRKTYKADITGKSTISLPDIKPRFGYRITQFSFSASAKLNYDKQAKVITVGSENDITYQGRAKCYSPNR